MAKIQIKSEKLTPFFLVIIYWSFASFAPHALKGQKLLDQGSDFQFRYAPMTVGSGRAASGASEPSART